MHSVQVVRPGIMRAAQGAFQRRLTPPLSGSLAIAALILSGCAYQPYPDLDTPDPIAQATASSARNDAGPGRRSASGRPSGFTSLPATRPAEPAQQPYAAADSGGPALRRNTEPPAPPSPASLPDARHRRLTIDLGEQRFRYFEDDHLIWSGPVSSGTREHPTPTGRFRVQSKDIDKRSGSYTNYFNQPTPMPYSLQFYGPYFIHEGYLPGHAASHGCVRLRYEDAKFVYARMQVGDQVIVTR